MKKLVIILVLLFNSFSNFTQAQDSLFTYVGDAFSDFTTEEFAMLDSLRADTLYDSVMIVEVSDIWNGLQQDGYLNVNLPFHPTMTADLFRIHQEDKDNPDSGYEIEGWFWGEMEDEESQPIIDYDGDIVLNKIDNYIFGSIRPFNSEDIYNIISIGSGKHVMLKFNNNAMQNSIGCSHDGVLDESVEKITGDCPKEIRVLILYTQNTLKYTNGPALLGQVQLNLLNGAVYNSMNANTQGLNFVLAGTRELNSWEFTESNDMDVDRTIFPNLPAIQSYRNSYDADLVICLTYGKEGSYNEYSGWAQNIGLSNTDAYAALVQIDAPFNKYVLAHEVGHLMGARHQQSWITDPGAFGTNMSYDNNGTFEHGYKITKARKTPWFKNYVDIMHIAFGGATDHVFSSPSLSWRNKIFGTVTGNDVVRTLFENACTVNGYKTGPTKFSAYVTGDNFAYTGSTVNLYAMPVHGVPGYNFEWWVSTDGGATYPTNLSSTFGSTGPTSFTMPAVPKVIVAMKATDGVNDVAWVYRTIYSLNIATEAPYICCFDITRASLSKPGKPTFFSEISNQKTQIIVSPNPSTDYVDIRTSISSKDYSGTFTINIIDINGKLIDKRYVYSANDTWRVDTKLLSSGTYNISFTGNDIQLTEKLSIVK